jgi:hypothetical protein
MTLALLVCLVAPVRAQQPPSGPAAPAAAVIEKGK